MRKYKEGNPKGPYSEDREPSERISEYDIARQSWSGGATLRGEAIGMAPDELINHALEIIERREKLIERLLRYVPRKYEDKVKELSHPLWEAKQALWGARSLIRNARLPLEAPVER